jgi:hypothetical protein
LERNRVVHLIGCDLDDDGRRLRSEHVHVQWLDKALPPTVGTEYKSGWWLSTRVFGESWIRVVSRDREFVDQVLSSVSRVDASTSGPCTPHHVLERNPRSRPEKPFDLTTMDQVDSVTLCQYEPQIGSNVGTSGLSRQAVVTGATAQELLQAMGQSQPVSSDACRPADINRLDIVLVAHLHSGTTTRQLYVTGPGCAGDRFGRTDDGTNVRTLSRAACDALLVPPIVPGNSMAATTKDCGW